MKSLITFIIIIFLTSGIRSQSRDTIYQPEYWEILTLDSTEIANIPYIRLIKKNSTTNDSTVMLIALQVGIKVQPQLDSLIDVYINQYNSASQAVEFHYLSYRKANNKVMRFIQIINGLIAIKEE